MIQPASQSAFDAQAIPAPEGLVEAQAALAQISKSVGLIGWVIQNPASSYPSADAAEDAVTDAIHALELALVDLKSHARPAARRGTWRAR